MKILFHFQVTFMSKHTQTPQNQSIPDFIAMESAKLDLCKRTRDMYFKVRESAQNGLRGEYDKLLKDMMDFGVKYPQDRDAIGLIELAKKQMGVMERGGKV